TGMVQTNDPKVPTKTNAFVLYILEKIWRLSRLVARLSATYACPFSNTLPISTLSRSIVWPWLLWIDNAHARISGNCTRTTFLPPISASYSSGLTTISTPFVNRHNGYESSPSCSTYFSTTPRLPLTRLLSGMFFISITCAFTFSSTFRAARQKLSIFTSVSSSVIGPVFGLMLAEWYTRTFPGKRSRLLLFDCSTWFLNGYSSVGLIPSSGYTGSRDNDLKNIIDSGLKLPSRISFSISTNSTTIPQQINKYIDIIDNNRKNGL
ncbi:hypothetical protein AYI68_g2886, partial [Smittium mucronatum]